MKAKSGMKFGGIFTVTCINKKTGKVNWIEKTHNIVTNEGLNHILDIVLHGGTQVSPWYFLIFNTDTTPLAAHTYAVPGFTEDTNYDEATRQEYVEAAASGQSITNSASRAELTMNSTTTIYGAALVSLSTKGDVAGGGTLLAAGQFTNERICYDDDTLVLQYTLSAADDGA